MKKERLLGMLKTALEMEERGFEFYRQASERTKDEAARDLFKTLQAEEAVHMRRIRAIYSSIESTSSFGSEWEKEVVAHKGLDAIFKGLAKRTEGSKGAEVSDIEAVETGLEFEARSVKFYEERLKEAESDAERAFLKAMVEEERTHYRALQDTKLYLTDPQAWFAANEGTSVDGG